MIKIAVPVNMYQTVFEHLERGGWPVAIPYAVEKGVYNVDGKEGIIATFRSQDIPLEVGQVADVGIVGSDWVKERQLEFRGLDIRVLTEFDSYGREFGTKPKLQLITFGSNPVSEPGQIPAGTIIRTEQPYLTRKFLMDNFGFKKVEIMGGNSRSFKKPQEFDLWCLENGVIGLRRIGGQPESFAALLGETGFATVVNETGQSLSINNLKDIATIEEIKVNLITTEEILADLGKRGEIERLKKDLEEAYLLISQEHEVQSLGPERRI